MPRLPLSKVKMAVVRSAFESGYKYVYRTFAGQLQDGWDFSTDLNEACILPLSFTKKFDRKHNPLADPRFEVVQLSLSVKQ